MRASLADDFTAERMLRLVELHVALRASHTKDGKVCGIGERIGAAEGHTVAETVAFPEGGPGASALDAREILFHGVIEFKIARVPEPVSLFHPESLLDRDVC